MKLDKETERKRLLEGKDRSEKLKKYFGFMPLSVLRLKNVRVTSKDLFNYQHETGKNSTVHHAKSIEKGNKNFEMSTWQGKGIGRGKDTFSIMPAELVDFFIKYYAKKGDLYFDPFAGQGIQLQVSNIRGIDYIGYDICKEYVDYISAFIPKLTKNCNILEIKHADSKKVHLEDNSVDFCFTSPPYWDIEIYDDNPEQLGINKTYEEFLVGMKDVAKELLRVFKPEGYCVININDFRKGGKFYAYHADVIRIYEEAGWKLYDLWILDEIVSGLVKIFACGFNSKKMAPKIHEYALVFRKEG